MRSFCLWLVLVLAHATGLAQPVFPVRDSGESRSRSFDVLHYRIEVSFDESRKTVFGKTTVTLVPLLATMDSIELDAEKMQFSAVAGPGGRELQFTVKPKSVVIALRKRAERGDTVSVTLTHSASPERGLYFVQPDSGYPDTPWQIWTQGEDMDHHFWFPCYDFPNDFATSEVLVTVRDNYTAVSNGRLLGVKHHPRDRTKVFHWKQSKPHAVYLIMLAIGEYAIIKDRAGSLPVDYYVYPGNIDDARICFRETPDMIDFFNRTIGFSYPWEKYAQVLIRNFVAGGMENTSATSLMDNITVFDARGRVDESPTSLIAHELAHQWWGDVVTCKDWRHLWLNEGFATYFDPLYFEYRYGRDEFEYQMYERQQHGINTDKRQGRKPLVSVGSYGNNVYSRGAAVLHMLRYILGDKLFWTALKAYITRHQFSPVETHDLKRAIEDATGQNLYWFFDQWVYRAGYPEFTVTSSYSDSTQTLSLTVAQTQKQDSLTGVFRTPVDIRVTTASGSALTRVNLQGADTVVHIPVAGKPRTVVFDEGNHLLKELRFSRPAAEWVYQADHADHAIDRILAIKELARDTSGARPMELFARRALEDGFYAVRLEGVRALVASRPSVRDDLVKATLLKAIRDPRSIVRSTATTGLSRFRGDEVESALRIALMDSSYLVVASAIRSLARVDSNGARAWLPQYLTMPSRAEMVASTALGVLARIDSAEGIRQAVTYVRYGRPEALRAAAIGVLRRSLKGNTDIERLFTDLLHDRMRWVRFSAAQALGDFGGVEALKALDVIAGREEGEFAQAAKRGADKIRERL